jgi:plasmid stabilization system protein ParE
MARVVVAPAAVDDLEQLIRSHSLPADTRERFKRSLRPLGAHPLLGAPLEGRWDGFRFVLGPWRWMLIVYAYNRDADVVAVVAVQDGRSSTAVTATR